MMKIVRNMIRCKKCRDVIESCTVYDFKFIGLAHNTVRGAAGGAVLCAEALTAKGYIAAK